MDGCVQSDRKPNKGTSRDGRGMFAFKKIACLFAIFYAILNAIFFCSPAFLYDSPCAFVVETHVGPRQNIHRAAPVHTHTYTYICVCFLTINVIGVYRWQQLHWYYETIQNGSCGSYTIITNMFLTHTSPNRSPALRNIHTKIHT
jgi:hypothetical protein